MKCPHCAVGIRQELKNTRAITFSDGEIWNADYQRCPECSKAILFLQAHRPNTGGGYVVCVQRYLAYPIHASGRPVPPEVPDPYRQDFDEAVAVLPISPKASAALSRRNLQAIIHDKAGIKGRDLNDEIQKLIDSGTTPSFISESLHAVRIIGNFAAHPIKTTTTGEIVDVEDEEAEWNLSTLESLFDFYFVQPELTKKRKALVNQKLTEAGKKTI